MHDFSVGLSAERNVAHVRLAGELDLAAAHVFEPVVGEVLGLGVRRVRVDLEMLWFCDVAGVRQLARARDRWDEHGLGVDLHGARFPVRQVFTLAGHGHLLSSAPAP